MLAAVAALAAAGCVKVNLTIEVEEDGSGRLDGIVAINVETFESLAGELGEDSGVSRDEICNQFATDQEFDTSDFDQAQPYDKDGFCGVQFETAFGPGELDQTLSGLDSGEATLRREGDGWLFELPFDESEFDTEDASAFPGFENIFGDAEYIVRVKLPGRQVDHNGTIDEAGFVVWDIDLTQPPDRLFLRTEPGDPFTGSDGGGGTGAVLLIVLLVLLTLGVGAYFLMRRRSEAEPDSGVAAPLPQQSPAAPPPSGATAPSDTAEHSGLPTTAPVGSMVVEDLTAPDPASATEASSGPLSDQAPTPATGGDLTGPPEWPASPQGRRAEATASPSSGPTDWPASPSSDAAEWPGSSSAPAESTASPSRGPEWPGSSSAPAESTASPSRGPEWPASSSTGSEPAGFTESTASAGTTEGQAAASPAEPRVIASPTPDQATGSPVWDPVRRKYVQWDPNHHRWLVFDDATQSWGPEQV